MALIDVVKFDSPNDEILVYKFPSENLRMGAQVIVNQSQEAVFVKGGKALDVLPPGTHTLHTGNIPILRRLINLPFGGDTPFTAEVWFANKTIKRDMRWGTPGPIQIIDAVYNYPVSVRAFGKWGFRIDNTQSFINQIVGSLSLADSNKIYDYFIGEIRQKLSDTLANFFEINRISVFQISARLNELSLFTTQSINDEFNRFGIEVVNFNIERISIPDEEQKKFREILGKRMEIEQISQANVGPAYVSMRSFDTLQTAAQNAGTSGNLFAGGLGLGMGVGAGVPLGAQMGQQMNVNSTPFTQAPTTELDPMDRLKKLKTMFDAGLISEADFNDKKKEILSGV